MTEQNLQSLLDESAIHRLLTDYAAALDAGEYDALDHVFTEDATAYYEGIGRYSNREEIKGLMQRALDSCGATQHLLGTVRIDVNGDEGTARCYLQAIHLGQGDHAGKLYTVWGEYRDRVRRTEQGWRIVHRELLGIHAEGDIGMNLS